jgi:tetratricopeptide (TPR) repeat protein
VIDRSKLSIAPSHRLRRSVWSAVAALVWSVASLAAADQRDPRLPELFAQLETASGSVDADKIARQIWDVWNSAGDEELDRLMRSGSRALQHGQLVEALQTFSELIERAPDFAEGWNKRATAYYQMRDYEASMRDVSVVLELEPRHFAALSGMGLIYTELEADAPALRWFERALQVHPYLSGIRERVAALHQRLDDSGI